MSKQQASLKKARSALMAVRHGQCDYTWANEVIAEIDDALAEQPAQQEPAAWISEVRCVGPEYGKKRYGALPVQSLQLGYYAHTPLYTSPPAQRTWVGLTDKEEVELWESTDSDWELMKRTESKLKDKNT